MTNRPDRKERKKRIKDQNAKAKADKREGRLTPDEMAAVWMIAEGLARLFMPVLFDEDEFPSEIPEEFPSVIDAPDVK